jgi:DNA-binding transcriptional ArsR family regulator
LWDWIEVLLAGRQIQVFNNANSDMRITIRVFSFSFNPSIPKMKKNKISSPESSGWSFFTNHAHVLLCLAEDPEMRLRDLAAAVGITERAVQKIISEVEAGGILERERQGRRNVYRIHGNFPLRHPVESHCTVQGLIDFVSNSKK